MKKEIKNIVRTVKPHHMLRSVLHPKASFQKLKYHYRRVSETDFIEFIGSEWNCSKNDVQEVYYELNKHTTLWSEIDRKLLRYPNNYASQMTFERSIPYLLVRLIKPKCIVETGVSAGVSSAYILQALQDNEKGMLYSIDLPPSHLPDRIDWIVDGLYRNI